MKRTPVLWTNDDIQHGQSRQMRRQLEFLAQFGIAGTFFLVPQSGAQTLDQDRELVGLLRGALARGHECYQHGHVHDPYESGLPDLSMLDFSAAVKERYTNVPGTPVPKCAPAGLGKLFADRGLGPSDTFQVSLDPGFAFATDSLSFNAQTS